MVYIKGGVAKNGRKIDVGYRIDKLAKLKELRAERPKQRVVLESVISQIAQTRTSRLNSTGVEIYFERLKDAETAIKKVSLPPAEKEKFMRDLEKAIAKSRES